MKMTKKEKAIFENSFGIYEDNDSYELEDWTSGGVNMIIYLDKNEKLSATQQFINYIDNFDIDEEIDIYREDKKYKKAFTIRQSLNDFEDWLEWLNGIKKDLLKGVKI